MALAVPTGIAALPIPPPRTQPGRTFLATCVDEACEQREDPWNTARLQREWVEQKLNAIEQKLTEVSARSEAATRPLQPIEHRLVQIMVDMPRDDLSLPGKVLATKVKARLRTAHKEDKFGRHALRHARNYVLYGELPPRRRR
jgi:hypothetical protein